MDQPPIIKPPTSSTERHEKLVIEWAAETIPSETHPERNEDSILTNPNERAFGVFDGVGGEAAGDVASTTARDCVLENLGEISDGTDIDRAKEALHRVLLGADTAVYRKSISDKKFENMGTTGTVLKFFTNTEGRNWALIPNIGDSRVYKINKDGTLEQITVDDDCLSALGLSEGEKKRIRLIIANARSPADFEGDELAQAIFRRRNLIYKSLNGKGKSPSIIAIPVEKGDLFLLTSDGVHDNLTTDEITEVFEQSSTPAEIAKNLKNNALARSREPKEIEMRARKDDMSVVVVACK